MRGLSLLSSLSLLLSLFSCQSDGSVQKMADELCQCMTPLAELVEKMQDPATSDSDFEDMMVQMNSLMTGTIGPCLDELENKHGEALQAQEKPIREAMLEKCPAVIEAMKKATEDTSQEF